MINRGSADAAAPTSYAIVTPSFRLDLERCVLLSQSVEKWVAPHVRHYIVVDRRDAQMFKPLASNRTSILIVEETAPQWLFRIPGIRRVWFSLRTRPIRNWILQQIVKLSVPTVVSEDVLLSTDSDTFFVAPYDPRNFEQDGKIPLFVETGQRGLIPNNDLWHQVAAKLLGVPAQPSYDTNYIGNVIPWRRETVLAIHRRIEEVAGTSWQQVLASQQVFAEYILYGLFTQAIPGQNARQWDDGAIRTLCYWKTVPLSVPDLQKLRSHMEDKYHSVMISAKSKTPVTDIRKVFL
jgi:Family of unknown function (DUF6492)